jgi:phenylpyruvate tautomerase PptA (4-oxalocrotonate tautomerase family)
MPIVDIELVLPKAEEIGKAWANALADALGAALSLPAGRLWVRLSRRAASHYAENGVPPHLTPHPVFVGILHAHPPEGEARKAEIAAITGAVAACIGRLPDAIHVTYAPPGAGRVAFGGALLE